MKYGTTVLTDGVLKITNAAPVNTGNFVTTVISQLGVDGCRSNLRIAFSAGRPRHSTANVVDCLRDSAGSSSERSASQRQHSGNLMRVIYLSGTPGTVFADGSFEFRNVVPGRHVIMTVDNPPATQALAASVVVGTGDLTGVEVSGTAVLPLNPRTPVMRIPSSTQTPGALPLATLRGHVLDAETGTPLKLGTVFVVGDSFARYELGAEGTFEFQRPAARKL
jgi:hypothetical protein